MTPNDDWNQWVSDFKEIDVEVPISRIAQRSAKELRLELAFSALIVPGVLALLVCMAVYSGSTAVYVLGALGIAVVLAATAAFFWLHRGTFSSQQAPARVLLDRTERQERARLRGIRLSALLTVLTIVAYFLWSVWLWFSGTDTHRDLESVLLSAALVLAVGLAALLYSYLYARKKQRALWALEELRRSFDNGAVDSEEDEVET